MTTTDCEPQKIIMKSCLDTSRRWYEELWPQMPDGSPWDGLNLLSLVRSGASPFEDVFDVNLLIQEVEEATQAQIVDVPEVIEGISHYAFRIKLSDDRHVVARLGRQDVNNIEHLYKVPPRHTMDVWDWHRALFDNEVAIYSMLENCPSIPTSRLLYHRPCERVDESTISIPKNIRGRQLFLFEETPANLENEVWDNPDQTQLLSIVAQTAEIRAALFQVPIPDTMATERLKWYLERISRSPANFQVPVGTGRELWIAIFTAAINDLIGDDGKVVGRPNKDDNIREVITKAVAAKESLLRCLPHILPEGDEFYRLVLEHPDFSFHNMSIFVDEEGRWKVTSIYDWQRGDVLPLMLCDLMTNTDQFGWLGMDYNGKPMVFARPGRGNTGRQGGHCKLWETILQAVTPRCLRKGLSLSDHMKLWGLFIQTVKAKVPELEPAVLAGKDARYLWFKMRAWRGEDPLGFYTKLGDWAEKKMAEKK